MKPSQENGAGNMVHTVVKRFVNPQGWAELIFVEADNCWFTSTLFISLS